MDSTGASGTSWPDDSFRQDHPGSCNQAGHPSANHRCQSTEVNALINVLARLGMTPAASLKMNLHFLDIPTPEPHGDDQPLG
jgi:hypothetical protein